MGGGARGGSVPVGGDRHRCPGAPRHDVLDDADGIVVTRHDRELRYRLWLSRELGLRRDLGWLHHHNGRGRAREHESIVMSVVVTPLPEASLRFACFGGCGSVTVRGTGPAGTPAVAAELVKRRMLEWHRQFSRFEPASELSRLNDDPRESVPVSALMARFVQAAVGAAAITGGLVDPTMVDQIERAGYRHDFGGAPIFPAKALSLAPPRRPASPSPAVRWRQVVVDRRTSTVTRPVGLRIDSGGIAKGLFGDVLAGVLSWHESFAVEAAGDVRFGGAAALHRKVHVLDPFEPDRVLHDFELASGAVATSGITRRAWMRADGQPAHHLLDPSTGEPAFTGIVQATALAPSGVEAEALAKAALLSGPEHARSWLCHGGTLVDEDGRIDVIDAAVIENAA